MNKQDYFAAKNKLQKAVHDAENLLAGMNSPGDKDEFFREIVTEINAVVERVWQIADRHKG